MDRPNISTSYIDTSFFLEIINTFKRYICRLIGNSIPRVSVSAQMYWRQLLTLETQHLYTCVFSARDLGLTIWSMDIPVFTAVQVRACWSWDFSANTGNYSNLLMKTYFFYYTNICKSSNTCIDTVHVIEKAVSLLQKLFCYSGNILIVTFWCFL